ncbi:hypothetical protein NLJ89_g5599 [Agrocybe chaxingu]|uniref:2'-phosphotransferase n=1 Tax=Agrocybe chaxingu TaxID=84603 RepID=A0A9W8K0S1_9AGAR|nr:hypothetical protein NLJ89_g5599 [Agrocybe chaxingu]
MGAMVAHSEVRHRTMMSSKPTGTYSALKLPNSESRLPSGQSVKLFRPGIIGLRKRVENTQQDLPTTPDVSAPSTSAPNIPKPQAKPQTPVMSPVVVPTPLQHPPKRVVTEVDGAKVTQEFLRTSTEYQLSTDKSPETVFTLTLAWLLRHAARDYGYRIVPDGSVRVSDVLRFFKKETLQSFSERCLADPGRRFELISLPDLVDGRLRDVWWVKAKRLHTIPGVSSANKRILNMGKLQTLVYRTTMEKWPYIQKYGIPEGPEHTIPLLQRRKNFFTNHIPEHKKYLCVTIDSERAARMGVMFFHTNQADLLAVGNRDGVIPLAACRSVVEMEVSKEKLR